jgi:NAD(P)H dehydrogenase (quinone)
MKISVILGHPAPGSFNHAIGARVVETLAANGHEVHFHDLYQENFDPVLPAAEIAEKALLPPLIQQHCDEIAAADGIIIIHPNWWGQPPAILKGWVDRVLRPGVAYQFLEGDLGEGVPEGLLKAHTALIFNTSNTPEDREREVFGDPLETLWNKCMLPFCCVKKTVRRLFGVVVVSTLEQRKGWLEEVEGITARYFPPA